MIMPRVTSGFKTSGFKTSGLKTSGLKTSGLKTSGLKTSGLATIIRRQRLEGCRRDLTDQSLRHQSITFIAHRWGFSEASGLSGRSVLPIRQARVAAGKRGNAAAPIGTHPPVCESMANLTTDS